MKSVLQLVSDSGAFSESCGDRVTECGSRSSLLLSFHVEEDDGGGIGRGGGGGGELVS